MAPLPASRGGVVAALLVLVLVVVGVVVFLQVGSVLLLGLDVLVIPFLVAIGGVVMARKADLPAAAPVRDGRKNTIGFVLLALGLVLYAWSLVAFVQTGDLLAVFVGKALFLILLVLGMWSMYSARRPGPSAGSALPQ